MNITSTNLESLINDNNKEAYNIIYKVILNEYKNAVKFTNANNLTEGRKGALGTCVIYLNSLVELLHSLQDLIDKGYIESGGSIAIACWERSLTLRKIMIEPELNSQIHIDHQKAKKTPWTIYKMVCDVLENERIINNIRYKRPYEEENFYMQYTLLSSIKHGNPYTISHLYRPGYSSNKKLFVLKPNDNIEDQDLKIYIKTIIIDNALDALIDYSKEFRTNCNFLYNIREQFDRLINLVKLQVPPIMLTTPEEMGNDYWDHLIEIEKKL
ncbi:hypothetical protein CMT52_05280 [Elizabethkingia anophelis]|nr:hypothetical protein [Elizabethkingia anophelis]MDV2444947.1 hypothetical protein [Elizabethkingia anophelis]MDV3927670.1 hypothetical protein [Elizabethkingia anophelis]MDV4023744.1 hypothetical protein [Elizabethkingia anophelis]